MPTTLTDLNEYEASCSQSKYMKASDVKEGDVVRIEDVTDETVKDFNTDEDVQSLCLHFSGGYKPYILRTLENMKMLRAFYGGDPNGWIGNDVELYTEPTKKGLGLRFRLPQGSKSPK